MYHVVLVVAAADVLLNNNSEFQETLRGNVAVRSAILRRKKTPKFAGLLVISKRLRVNRCNLL